MEAAMEMMRQCIDAMQGMMQMMDGTSAMSGMVGGIRGPAAGASGGDAAALLIMSPLGWTLGALIAAGALVLIGVAVRRRRPRGAHSPARQELDRRYAIGRLDRDTYLAMRADLAPAR
ncbi:MAG: hypothetical protein ACRDFZ_02260, partial [Candidatus Limnocylindria bacterium]